MESSYQPIIPGLPDELALKCLAKITHGYHGCLETVSKRWRDVLRSAEYSSYKAKEGCSGDWVFLLTDNSKNQWIAYDPDADRWHPIPMIPRKEQYAWSDGFGCVCVGSRFLVIGGSYCKTNPRVTDERPLITNQVFQFDTFTKEWSEAASMKTPRAFFGCCEMSGKVYVCGGRNHSHVDGLALAEVYDPLTNKWEELPRMHDNLVKCISFSYNGNFYAFAYLGYNMTEIFDPSNQVWRTEQMNWPLSYGQLEVQVTQDGRLYAYLDGRGTVVTTMDNRGEWRPVARLPSIVAPADGYPRVGSISNNGFVALGNELYVMGGLLQYGVGGLLQYGVGGKNVKPAIKSLDLDRCWIWDGKWRETRPLCRPSCGTVKGFAALKASSLPLDKVVANC